MAAYFQFFYSARASEAARRAYVFESTGHHGAVDEWSGDHLSHAIVDAFGDDACNTEAEVLMTNYLRWRKLLSAV